MTPEERAITERAERIASTIYQPWEVAYQLCALGIEEIQRMAVAEAQRWIPVGERLPEAGRVVPLTFISLLDGQPTIGAGEWRVIQGEWYDVDARRIQVTVTHWLDVLPPEAKQ